MTDDQPILWHQPVRVPKVKNQPKGHTNRYEIKIYENEIKIYVLKYVLLFHMQKIIKTF